MSAVRFSIALLALCALAQAVPVQKLPPSYRGHMPPPQRGVPARKFHVVMPDQVDDNPFAGMQGTANAIRQTPAAGVAAGIPQRFIVKRIPQPSARECDERETRALTARLADPKALQMEVRWNLATFEKNGLPIICDAYADVGGELRSRWEYHIGDMHVSRLSVTMPPNARRPEPSAVTTSFVAGSRFTILRDRALPLPCGMCEGAKRIPTETRAPENDPTNAVVLDAECPRCKGSGTTTRSVPTLYTIAIAR